MTSGQVAVPTAAPVLDFICLFTHDLKRKQKRWQDGRLKFHTFNRRVMVYDERGNFIGDTHWVEDASLENGDEVQLDRGNVIVQVSDCVGQTEQDISGLFARKPKPTLAAANSPQNSPRHKTSSPCAHFQLRHLPLQNLLSTPGRQVGRAVIPKISPFEERRIQQRDSQNEEDRNPKRRKYEDPSKVPYATSLFGTQLSLSSQPPRSLPLPRSSGSREKIPSLLARPPKDSILPPVSVKLKPKKSSVRTSSAATDEGQLAGLNTAPKSIPRQKRSHTKVAREQDTEEVEVVDVQPLRRDTTTVSPHSFNSGPLAVPRETVGPPAKKRAKKTPTELPSHRGDEPGGLGLQVKDYNARMTPRDTAGSKGLLGNQIQDHPPREKERDEPTTELRLGARKKRGLMLVKEPARAKTPETPKVVEQSRMRAPEAPKATELPRMRVPETPGAIKPRGLSIVGSDKAVGDRLVRIPSGGKSDTPKDDPPQAKPPPPKDIITIEDDNERREVSKRGSRKMGPAKPTEPRGKQVTKGSEKLGSHGGGRNGDNVLSRPKRPSNGGPWSREAYDLLDHPRPSGTAKS